MKQPPKSWAKLTLYDRVLHSDLKAMRPAAFNKARRFSITDRASERIREAMASAPELIGENSEFAIPPFDPMWIEFNSRILLRHEKLSGNAMEYDPTADVNVGYLFHGKEVTVYCEGENLEPIPLPIKYRLNTFMSMEEQQKIAEWFGVSRIGIDPFLWGHEMTKSLDDMHRPMLRRQHSMEIGAALLDMDENERQDVYLGSAGDLRNIIAILLMINQPAKIIQTREVPRQRGLVKGKSVAYYGHSEIDIDLDRRKRVSILTKPKRGQANWQLRWHEVRGHFVHNHTNGTDHAHEWEEIAPRKWKCQVEGCKATRTWREYPEGKGTAEKGFIKQRRVIKTKEDANA